MKRLSPLSKTFLFITILTGSLWLGGYLLRMILFYQLFQEEELLLRAFISEENLPGIFMVLRAAVAFTLILYPLFIVSFLIFLLTSGLNLKSHGWLFIVTILIGITLPLEIYLMTIDYSMVFKINYSTFDAREVLNLVVKRFKVLSSFPIIELLCYFSIIYLMIFQPLKKEAPVN